MDYITQEDSHATQTETIVTAVVINPEDDTAVGNTNADAADQNVNGHDTPSTDDMVEDEEEEEFAPVVVATVTNVNTNANANASASNSATVTPSHPGTNTSTNNNNNATNSPLENARNEVQLLMEQKEFGDDEPTVSAIQTLFRENEAMKEKVTKLKTLLGRSAKAQRDLKVEMEQLQKKYDSCHKENGKLQSRIHQLSARPTHLDLLADFETNFDRALLSVQQQQQQSQSHHHATIQQSGGQATGGTTTTATAHTTTTSLDISENRNRHHNSNSSSTMDHLLVQELADAKKRIETLEQYNATLVQRCTQLENQSNTSKHGMAELMQKISHIELEKKMAQMEVDHMAKQLQYNQSSLDEMQLEIELLSKQSTIQQTAAHRRDDQRQQQQRSLATPSDPQLIQHLQEQVKALEEWAVASNHAKTIANDRIRLLEQQLLLTAHQPSTESTASIITDVSTRSSSSSGGGGGTTTRHAVPGDHHDDISHPWSERVLETRKASLVIGAGDVGVVAFELDPEQLKSVNSFTQRIALRWRFDILQGPDSDIAFSIFKGKCTSAFERRNADTVIPHRTVKGGAGGEIDEHAFSIQRSCTVVWSNQHSWIRPRTIKYILEAIVMDD